MNEAELAKLMDKALTWPDRAEPVDATAATFIMDCVARLCQALPTDSRTDCTALLQLVVSICVAHDIPRDLLGLYIAELYDNPILHEGAKALRGLHRDH
jgi:hypothetical protein